MAYQSRQFAREAARHARLTDAEREEIRRHVEELRTEARERAREAAEHARELSEKARRLAEELGGSVELEASRSELGGALFIFLLAADEDTADAAEGTREPSSAQSRIP